MDEADESLTHITRYLFGLGRRIIKKMYVILEENNIHKMIKLYLWPMIRYSP